MCEKATGSLGVPWPLAFIYLNPSWEGIPSAQQKGGRGKKVGDAKRKEFDKYCLVEDLHTRAGQLLETLSSKSISLGQQDGSVGR